MVLNFLVVAMLLVITMLWGIRGKGRGLFSSLLTFLCVLVAGAIAFGVWEPLTHAVFLDWRPDLAWGLGLALPFAVSLGLLRLLVELLVPNNVKVDDLSNFIGGAVLGFGSAVITVGIVILSLGSVNFGPTFLGYEPIDQTNGDLVHESGLWVPADKWTTTLYEHMSLYSFGTGEQAMAIRHPDLYEHVSMSRLVYNRETNDGRTIARNDLLEGQASIVGAYKSPDQQLGEFLSSQTILAPRLSPKNPDGEPTPADGTMHGFVVRFEPGARDAGGQVVIGPGQVRLVYRIGSRTADAVHPHAIISDPEATTPGKRWFPRNAKNLFVPSVGGESSAIMGFEFALPANATPVDLIVKNLRLPIEKASDLEVREFASARERDGAILSGSGLFAGAGGTVGELDRSQAVASNEGASSSRRLPGGRVLNITSGLPGSLTLDDNMIIGGRAQVLDRDLRERGLDRNSRADEFADTSDTAVVQIELASGGQTTPMGRLVQGTGLSGRPFLIDAQGRTYDAIGYVYSDGVRTWIRYEPGSPLASMNDIEDQLSTTSRDQTLVLLFRPTRGVTITGFAIGETLVGRFSLPVPTSTGRR